MNLDLHNKQHLKNKNFEEWIEIKIYTNPKL